MSKRILDSLEDLTDIWLQAENYSREEVYSIFSKLINTIKAEKSNFVSDAKYYLEEKCLDDNICPNCFHQLLAKTHLESRGEYQGFPVSEEMGELSCKSCGWTQDT